MKYTVIDVETAQGKRWSICQLGIVIVEDDKIIDQLVYFIKPPHNKYQRFNTQIHGINSSLTADKPSFPEIWSLIKSKFVNRVIVGHNVDFDIDCIRQTLDYYGLEIPRFITECTYKKTGLRLEDLCLGLDIKLERCHDALSDAIACAETFIKLKNNHSINYDNIPVQRSKSMDYGMYEKIKGEYFKPDYLGVDPNGIFYKKKVVITGVFQSISRNELAKKMKLLGADIDTAISKRTNYVIVGENPGPVKMRKVDKYNLDGAEIEILKEDEILEHLS